VRFGVEHLTANLQVLRAAHAVAEAGHTLCVSSSDAPVIAYLAERFPLQWEVGKARTAFLEIDHATPRTTIGDVSRALIFPRGPLERCRKAWCIRDHRFAFAGLMTAERLKLLSEWSLRSGGKALRQRGGFWRKPSALISSTRLPPETKIWASTRGRTYPVKAWDDEYYRFLGKSQFALCPSGDFAWTYRVFEAALCGAIPVVQQTCEAYGELVLFSLDDDASSLAWDIHVAEHNRAEAMKLVTATTDELSGALA
jgi:hypothetical protein